METVRLLTWSQLSDTNLATRLFFFNDTATTEIYTSIDTLSLHDALPIGPRMPLRLRLLLDLQFLRRVAAHAARSEEHMSELQSPIDISYAVFCLKKKKTKKKYKKQFTEHIKKKDKKKKKKQ